MKRDPETVELTDRLAAPFDPAEVKWKPQMVKNNRALAMCYVDARLIQDRLDEVVGPEGWQDEYELLADGSAVCRLRVRLGPEWVTKTDVGSPSEQPDQGDRVKAAFSDALKRAAVKFGVGRYLYRLPSQWVDYDPAKKQFAAPPQMPAAYIPADCKPCGAATADRLAGLIRTVCERTRSDVKLATNKVLEEFRVPQGKGLPDLRVRDANAVFQRLNAKLGELAKGPAPTPQPAAAGK